MVTFNAPVALAWAVVVARLRAGLARVLSALLLFVLFPLQFAQAQITVLSGKTLYEATAQWGAGTSACKSCHFSNAPPSTTQTTGAGSAHPFAANNAARINNAFAPGGVMASYFNGVPNYTVSANDAYKLSLYIGQFKAPLPSDSTIVTRAGVAGTRNVYALLPTDGTSGVAQDSGGVTATNGTHGTTVVDVTAPTSGNIAYNITYTPSSATYVGTDSFTYKIINPAAPSPASSTISVTVVGVTSAGTVAGQTGQALAYSITTNGTPSGGSPYGVSGSLPPGVSLNPGTGTISGTPLDTAAGSYPITVTVSTTVGPISKDVTFNIDGITSTSTPSSVVQGSAFSYQISTLLTPSSYSLGGTVPSGMSVSSSGLITWTPPSHGSFPVTMQIVRSGIAMSRTLTVTVTSAGAPVITTTPALSSGSPPTVIGTINSSISPIQINATNPPISSGSYGASGLGATGLTLNANTGVISGTPNASGDFPLVLSASNGATGSLNVTVRINPSGAPGVTSGATAAATVGTPGNVYLVTASNGPITGYAVVAPSVLPAGLTLNPATGQVSGNPSVSGIFDVVLSATNTIALTGTKVVRFTIAPNTGPAITSPTAVSVMVGVAITPIQVVASNPPITSYGATGLPAGLVIDSVTGIISGTPTSPTPVGSPASVTLTASNGVPPIASLVVPFTVTAAAPVAGAVAMMVSVNTPATLDLGPSVTGSGITGISIVTPPSHGRVSASGTTVTYTPNTDYFGVDAFTYVGYGSGGTSPAGTVSVTVTGRPDPTKAVAVGAILNAQISAVQRFAGAQIGNFSRRTESLHAQFSGNSARIGSLQPDAVLTGAVAASGTMPQVPALASSGGDGGGRRPDVPGAPVFLSKVAGLDAVASGLGLKSLPLAESMTSLLKDRSINLANLVGTGSLGTADANGGTSFWVEGVASFGRRDANGNASGLAFSSDGISVGADRRVSDKLTVGVGLGLARDSTAIGTDGSENNSKGISATVYGSYQTGPSTFVDGMLGVGLLDFDSRRYVAPINDVAVGNRKGYQLFGGLTASYEYRDNGLLISPYGRLDFAMNHLKEGTEVGGGVYALHYFGQTSTSLQGTVGVRSESIHSTGFGWVIPRVRAEFRHEFRGDGDSLIAYADQIGGTRYAITAGASQRNAIALGLGSDFLLRDGWTMGLDYQLTHSFSQDSSYALRVKLTKDFDVRGIPKAVADFVDIPSRPSNIQVDAGYTHDDNVTRAKAGADQMGDDSYAANISKTTVFTLSDVARVLVTGSLGGEKFRHINGLSKLTASLEGDYQYRATPEFDAVTYGAFARLMAEQHESDMRDGFRVSVGLSMRQSITDRINAFGALSYNQRFANSDVFNTRDVSGRVNFDYAVDAKDTLYLGAEYRRGDIISTGRASLENVSIAKVMALDDAFAGGQFFSYRFEGDTVLTTLGYNKGLGPRDSVDFSWRRVQSTPSLRPSFVTSPRSYIDNQWSATYLMRF